MALRELKDLDGRLWQVWESRPTAPAADSAEGRYFGADRAGTILGRFGPGRAEGWLTFTSGDERRRLSPIPDGWQNASDALLRRHLAAADRVRTDVRSPS